MTFAVHNSLPQMQPSDSAARDAIKDAAVKLETAFLAEMLKASGVGKPLESFGGGVGEDQFSSFLREAQAREIARAGGLGLAVHFERALAADHG